MKKVNGHNGHNGVNGTKVAVKLLKNYWPSDGSGKVAAGSVIDLGKVEADTIIAAGIGAVHVPVTREEWLAGINKRVAQRCSRSEATRRLYESDFRQFQQWCEERGLEALPVEPATLARYMLERHSEGIASSTIGRNAKGICAIHAEAGCGRSDTVYQLAHKGFIDAMRGASEWLGRNRHHRATTQAYIAAKALDLIA